jgi:hypothetical protein
MIWIIIVILFLFALGAMPTWPYAANWGYGWYPSGGLWVIMVVILIIFLLYR